MTKAGFVALVGRPNAGKSTLLNALLGEKIAMVSQKANATRRRLNAIVMHGEDQLIFVDTPGLHEKERKLNQFMLEEALKAIGDCDLIVYLAPAADSVKHYKRFLEIAGGKKHLIALSKIDQISQGELLARIAEYNAFSEHFEALIPVSVTKHTGLEQLKEVITRFLPESPYLFDPEDLTNEKLRDIFREFIRESIFENISDEIPYGTDVVIDKIDEADDIDHIRATIIVEKESQKGIMIGKSGATIKRIGKHARQKIESLSGHRAYLDLFVSVKPNWTNDKKMLEDLGYQT
ncbi:GTPase Era [Sulfurimonas sp. HSL-3221]|uniref:GTPase Era n=1 Tax=Sulfurimonadaceae TaxID=2771471 RepID=UPI001E3644C9|nr:GTPase Era [Sulfurimonas sp. HSL-3221]UFS63200.1 GTPase Era [Sulfurimonas sp. HSL-3221]